MLNSETTGEGKNHIIFIHGNSQSLRIWDSVINNFALSPYTLVTVDLPGHGNSFRSNVPIQDYTLKGSANHLAQFLQTFEEKKYIVVTASVASNIFTEAIPFVKNCWGAFFIAGSIIGEQFRPVDILLPNPEAMTCFIADPSDEQLEKYLDHVILNKNDFIAREKFKQDFLRTDKAFRQVLADCVAKGEWSDEIKNLIKMNRPVAFIYGSEEAIVNSLYLTNAGLNIWKNQIIFVKDAGHSVQLDQSAQLAGLITQYAVDVFKSDDF